jgi:hypothetical protein
MHRRIISVSLVAAIALSGHLRAEERGVLAASVQPFVDREELAGAVMLVAGRDKVLAVEAAGWAGVGVQEPMRTDSIFWIASQSKPITAAALMILVDEGKVQLDDYVEKFLPQFQGQMFIAEKDAEHRLLRKPRHPITIRNVLSHTSGLPFKSAIETPTLDLWPLSLRVRSYADEPLDFDPDTKYQYSNAGINTAARIIEGSAIQKSQADWVNWAASAPAFRHLPFRSFADFRNPTGDGLRPADCRVRHAGCWDSLNWGAFRRRAFRKNCRGAYGTAWACAGKKAFGVEFLAEPAGKKTVSATDRHG